MIITPITIFGIYLRVLIFQFNFTFYKIIHPRGIPVIKCKKFIWSKVENIFISISLKIDICLWTLLLLNITSQLTDQAKRWYGGGYSILRLSLQYVIWRWQFECNEGWTPPSTIKFGWSVNIKSIQEEVCGSRWVGCDIIWWNPYTLKRDSSCVPLIVVLSLVHQTEDLALKSP